MLLLTIIALSSQKLLELIYGGTGLKHLFSQRIYRHASAENLADNDVICAALLLPRALPK